MESVDWTPLVLSLQLAAVTTVALLGGGMGLAYLLHMHVRRGKALWRALTNLPLVLPPTVLGYYLLLAFRPEGWLSRISQAFGGPTLAFSFAGLVLGSMLFSLPFMLNPLLSALEALPRSYTEAALTLGKSPFTIYRRILLPNIRGAILLGAVLTFAHTIGEFGVVLMIGGNIPGLTRVASIAMYHAVEGGQYATADAYAVILLVFSLVVLLLVYGFRGQKPRGISV
ncbi:MAG: molybdate ABC transporter permease subunit [Bacteroidota bacterium]